MLQFYCTIKWIQRKRVKKTQRSQNCTENILGLKAEWSADLSHPSCRQIKLLQLCDSANNTVVNVQEETTTQLS